MDYCDSIGEKRMIIDLNPGRENYNLISKRIIKKYLCCPSEGSLLIKKNAHLTCKICLRNYPITREGIIDLIPNGKNRIKLSEVHKKWRDRSLKKANSDEYKRSKEGTFFERKYHTLKYNNYKKVIEKYALSTESILDIGISTGYPIKLYPPSKIFFGLDINLKNLQRCYRYMHRDQDSKVLFLVRGDTYNLPFKKESFDLITMFTTLHRLDDIKIFQHLGNFLKTNGRFIVSVPWKSMILWNQKIRKTLWKLNIFSDSKELRDSFSLNFKRYSRTELIQMSRLNLKIINIIYPSHLTELIGVYEKI